MSVCVFVCQQKLSAWIRGFGWSGGGKSGDQIFWFVWIFEFFLFSLFFSIFFIFFIYFIFFIFFLFFFFIFLFFLFFSFFFNFSNFFLQIFYSCLFIMTSGVHIDVSLVLSSIDNLGTGFKKENIASSSRTLYTSQFWKFVFREINSMKRYK